MFLFPLPFNREILCDACAGTTWSRDTRNLRMTRCHKMLLEASVQVLISFELCSYPARSTPPLIIVSSTVLWLDITEVVDFQTLLACFSCTSNSVSLWCLSTVPFAFMQPKRTVLSTQFKMRPKIPCLPSSPTSHVSSYFTVNSEAIMCKNRGNQMLILLDLTFWNW